MKKTKFPLGNLNLKNGRTDSYELNTKYMCGHILKILMGETMRDDIHNKIVLNKILFIFFSSIPNNFRNYVNLTHKEFLVFILSDIR